MSTTALVQQALLDPEVSPGTRQALTRWVRAGFVVAADRIAADVAARQPAPTVVHTEVGMLEVGPEGAEPGRLARLDALAVQRWSASSSSARVPAVVAGVALVLGLVLLATGPVWLGVLLAVVAAVAGVVAARILLRARTARRELTSLRERIRERVEAGRTAAVAARAASLETSAEVAMLARAVSETGSAVRTER